MSKVTVKYIKWGTGANEVNSRAIPANYTASNYTPAQIAAEGDDKISAHLKGIDTALASAGGIPTDISLTSFSMANNVSTPANITGLAFANGSVRSFEALISISIDATAELYEVIKVLGIQKAVDWDISISSTGDNSLISLSITSSGQLQYVCSNYSGFVSGTIKFRANTTTI